MSSLTIITFINTMFKQNISVQCFSALSTICVYLLIVILLGFFIFNGKYSMIQIYKIKSRDIIVYIILVHIINIFNQNPLY